MAPNRFISLAPDDPDDSDEDNEPSPTQVVVRPTEDGSAPSETTEYLSLDDGEQDNPYFQLGTDPLPREQWKPVAPIDFTNEHEALQTRQTLDELFHVQKEIEAPLGMDSTQQIWRWADIGSRQMPRAHLTYPTLDVEDANGIARPTFSQADRISLFSWILEQLSWLPQYDTVYVLVDNRQLAGANPPDYWPLLAPWIQARCTVVGPFAERTTAIHFPINTATGLQQVHYTWAGALVLEALCLVHPTVIFALMDSDCVPTALFEVAELVNLMTDPETREHTMRRQTMASSAQCPPAVLLMTEARAELNAGLIIVTGHAPTQTEDIEMEPDSTVDDAPQGDKSSPRPSNDRAPKSRRLAPAPTSKTPEEWITLLQQSRASFLSTTSVPEDPAEAIRGGLALTPLLGTTARTPLEWAHAWAMLGEWAGIIAFPVPRDGVWLRHGDSRYLRPEYAERTPPFLTWARPIFEQGALSPMSILPADFPIICLPGDNMFQSKDLATGYSLPPLVHAFHKSKVGLGQKLAQWRNHGLQPLPISLLGVEQAPPLWTHPDGCDFIRGTSITIKPHVMEERRINEMQALLLKSLWTPVELPNHNNNHTPWPANSQPVQVFCGQQASVQLSADKIKPLLTSLQQKLAIDSAYAELELNEILASHRDLRYSEWKNIIMANPDWQRNAAQAKATEIQCSGLGGAELDADWDVLLACKCHAHVYGPSLSKQDDWPTRAATVAGTAHTQEYLMLHIAMLPIGLHAWRRVLGVQTEPPVQAQIIGNHREGN